MISLLLEDDLNIDSYSILPSKYEIQLQVT